ncbi:DUF1573 domain-containing protein [Flavihumibacter fluvii]|uniref:DUF1573 domain-containing protein n=1 Tax=Flavihumibacter fluvii TaxID=2838157 RepID=UPI001BDF514C|nr:DUF1573 domain-containing protein [Flavihumibacter fluvii]ULQ54450.1 DUF1573 domain-containing protein [Flavihumibacter fluvii]
MRLAFVIATFILTFVACKQGAKDVTSNANSPVFTPSENPWKEKIDSANFTSITWLDGDQDYGKVDEGQQVEVAFRFRNSGDKPLIIYSVQPACGCTAAEPPKEPILPGKEGVIKGSFNSSGRAGTNNKSIAVQANTTGGMEHNLHFKVEVIKK